MRLVIVAPDLSVSHFRDSVHALRFPRARPPRRLGPNYMVMFWRNAKLAIGRPSYGDIDLSKTYRNEWVGER